MSNFKREITLFSAVMLVAGTMIGSGIFIVSSDMARQLGSAGWLMVAWIISGFITLAGALSYGELSGMFPHAGGQYIYLQKAYGKLPAFLYGWTLFLVIQTGTIAAVGVAFAKFSGVLFPSLNETNYIFQSGNFHISTVQILAICITCLLTFINSRGVKYGSLIQNVFGVGKIGSIIILILLVVFTGINYDVFSANIENMWNAKQSIFENGKIVAIHSISGTALVVAIGVAMVGSLFSSDAWNNVTFAGDEIKNPQKTIGRALAYGTGLVTILYLAVNLLYISVLPVLGNPDAATASEHGIAFATNDRVAVAAAETLGGNIYVIGIAILIMVSTFGCQNGCILSGARVYYKMATDGLFFSRMGKLNSRGVPANALWMQCIWASLLCLSGSYGNLLDYVMFAVISFYILTIVGIFVLRKKMPDAERPYRVPFFPLLPILYIILATAFVYIILTEKPDYTLPGLLIVALGVPAFYVFRKYFA